MKRTAVARHVLALYLEDTEVTKYANNITPLLLCIHDSTLNFCVNSALHFRTLLIVNALRTLKHLFTLEVCDFRPPFETLSKMY